MIFYKLSADLETIWMVQHVLDSPVINVKVKLPRSTLFSALSDQEVESEPISLTLD